MSSRLYHVGLTIENHVATYHYRRNIDFMPCEIYEYLGKTRSTKKEERARIKANSFEILGRLNRRYPDKDIRRIEVD